MKNINRRLLRKPLLVLLSTICRMQSDTELLDVLHKSRVSKKTVFNHTVQHISCDEELDL